MDAKKVLIVDDDPFELDLLERLLKTKKFSVVIANNGEEAVTLAKDDRPDLIIMDIQMPGMGGGEAAAVLGEDPDTQHIPIIFLTGLFSEEEVEARAHNLGGCYFMAKPVKKDELFEVIEKQIFN